MTLGNDVRTGNSTLRIVGLWMSCKFLNHLYKSKLMKTRYSDGFKRLSN